MRTHQPDCGIGKGGRRAAPAGANQRRGAGRARRTGVASTGGKHPLLRRSWPSWWADERGPCGAATFRLSRTVGDLPRQTDPPSPSSDAAIGALRPHPARRTAATAGDADSEDRGARCFGARSPRLSRRMIRRGLVGGNFCTTQRTCRDVGFGCVPVSFDGPARLIRRGIRDRAQAQRSGPRAGALAHRVDPGAGHGGPPPVPLSGATARCDGRKTGR